MSDDNRYEKPPPYSPFADQNSYFPIGSQSQPVLNPNQNQFINASNYGSIGCTQPIAYSTGPIVVPIVEPQVLFIGSCPACRVGILEEDYTCLGILLAILFFPIGILCCLAFRQRRCPNCGTTFE